MSDDPKLVAAQLAQVHAEIQADQLRRARARCAPDDHTLLVEVNQDDDPDAPPVTVKCSGCGLTLSAVLTEYTRFQAKAQGFMDRLNRASGVGPQELPPSRIRPSDQLPGYGPRRTASGRIISDEDHELAQRLVSGVGGGFEHLNEAEPEPHLAALRAGLPLDNGITDERLNVDGFSTPPYSEETRRREMQIRGDQGGSGILTPGFE